MQKLNDMELILKYFPELTETQIHQFEALEGLYKDWNAKINVVSRKDIDELYLRHVLHSLAIAKVIQFKDNSTILDVGTGGGFPGVPLAIMFPNCKFHLVDSINKKLKVVKMNVDESMSTPAKYGIMSIPALLLFKGGDVVETIVGALPQGKIVDMLSKYL